MEDAKILKNYVEEFLDKKQQALGYVAETQDRVLDLEFRDCPQQPVGSVECGVVVCHLMFTIANTMDVETDFRRHNCMLMHKTMVHEFLHHGLVSNSSERSKMQINTNRR
ncbi:hypothetical protein L1049_019659 [Liquidambar formosana]|uniref:Ubiquitin-like protease family profile domain-containing protein n=1 Tax=Liquidambar formosana TaxID=63359 RepID=A0AAP0SBY6_LIQFO